MPAVMRVQVAPPSVNQRPVMTAALPGRGQQHIGIVRVEHHVGDAGVLAGGQDLLPGLAVVGGLVEAAFAACSPQPALRRHVDHVAVARIDDDLADMAAGLESQVLPGLSAVIATIHTIPIRHASLAVVFSGADPDHVWIFRIERDVADGVRAFAVEDGRPCGSGVGGLPDAARGHGHVVERALMRRHGEANDASRDDGGADRAQAQSTDGSCERIGRGSRGGSILCRSGGGWDFLGGQSSGGQYQSDECGQRAFH